MALVLLHMNAPKRQRGTTALDGVAACCQWPDPIESTEQDRPV